MKYTFLFACAIILSVIQPAFSSETVTIVQKQSGVTILFKNPEVVIPHNVKSAFPRIAGLSEVDYIAHDSAALETISFTLAVPSGSEPRAALSAIRFKTVENFTGHDTFKNLRENVQVEKLGIKRGVHLVRVRLQPYSFKNGRLAIIDSGSVEVSFGTGLPATAASRLSETEAGFFHGVNNQTQLAAIVQQSLKTNRKADRVLKAQNGWYDPAKEYVRIATKRDGVARVSMRDVITAQPAFNGKSSANFHLIFKGEKYPFAFINDANSVADETDELIFLGSRAAGDTTWFDTYTTEAVFYLTYDGAEQGERLQEFPSVSAQDEMSTVKIHSHIEMDSVYNFGDLDGYNHNTEPGVGEGYFWKGVDTNNPFVTYIDVAPSTNSQDSIEVSVRFHTSINSPNVKLRIFVNGKGSEILYSGSLQDRFVSIKMPASAFNSGKNLVTVRTYDHVNSISIDYVLLNGTVQAHAFDGTGLFTITRQPRDKQLKISGLSSEPGYAIDSLSHSIFKLQATSGIAFLPLKSDRDYRVFIGQSKGIETALVAPVNRTELFAESNQADVLIITHYNFKSEALRLAEYRAKTRGLAVLVVDVEDVYKEFDFGGHSPHAIKNFLKHTYNTWQKPSPGYVILFGDASWDARKVTDGATETDFVPVYGRPVSDYWFTLLEGEDHLSEMHVGRLPVSSFNQAKAVVNKLIEYDTLQPQPWMKKFMAITGGFDEDEAAGLFENFAGQPATILVDPIFGFAGDTATFSRFIPNANGTGIPHYISKEDSKGTDAIGNNAKQYINEGVGWVSFMGHGSPQITEIGNWMPDQIANGNRYFFLNTFSCQIGAFAEPVQSINEQFIRAENKGAIAAFGTTGFGYPSIDGSLVYRLTEAIVKKNLRELGQVIDYAKHQLRPDESHINDRQYKKNTVLQYSLLGDPLTRFPVDTTTDLYFIPQDVETSTLTGLQTFTVDDAEVHISTNVRNNGTSYGHRFQERPFTVLAIHDFNGSRDTIAISVPAIGFKSELDFSVPVFGKPGTHTITLIADPDSVVAENRRNNNLYTFAFEVYEKTPLALDPLAFWDVNAEDPVFRIINPFKNSGNVFDYDFKIVTEDTVSPQMIFQATTRTGSGEINVTETFIEWKPGVPLQNSNGYIFQARLFNRTTEQESNWLTIPFTAKTVFKNNQANWSTQSRNQLALNILDDVEFLKDTIPALGLKVKNIPVRVVSVGFPRSASIEVGSEYQGSNTDQDGIHVRVYSPNDTVAKHTKFYIEMWPDWSDEAPGVVNADNFIKFFQSDSISEGDYVIITFAQGAIQGALKDSATTTRYIDFKNAFKSIGSALIDSFQNANSYAIFGRRGMKPGEAIEAWDGSSDSLEINSFIPYVENSGRVETAMIGPAKKWDSVSISGALPENVQKWKWTVSAFDRTKTSGKVLFSGDSLTTLKIDSLPAQEYPFLKMELVIDRKIQDEKVFLNGINAAFEPEAELAILPSRTVMEPGQDILRGDSVVNTSVFKNISRRSASAALKATFDIKAVNGSPQVSSVHAIPVLQPDEEFIFKDTVGTTNFTLESTVSLTGDGEKSLNELYTFNNAASYPLVITDDKIPPVIDLFVDSREVQNGDLVQLTPSVLVRIWDNSRLSVTAGNTEIRINGKVLDSAGYTAKFHRQVPRVDTTGEYRFIPLGLENGENLFIITSQDASGNTTEKKVRLLVSTSYVADNIRNSPNPFSEGTTFSFMYKGQELTVPGRVEIHNISGQKVRDMDFTAELGENTFFWDGRDNIGTQLPAGMYFYKIQLLGRINAESVYGKCVIVR